MTPNERHVIILLFGGQSPEHDVSCVSARHILGACDPNIFTVIPVGIHPDGRWIRATVAEDLHHNDLRGELPDSLAIEGPEVDQVELLTTPINGQQPVVFPIIHGPNGEDGTLQGLFEVLNVPYVGSGVLGSAASMNKAVAKTIFQAHGVPQPQWRQLPVRDVYGDDVVLAAHGKELLETLGNPVFVKPANMGSSIGINKVRSVEEFVAAVHDARRYDREIIVEETITGRELECGVLGNDTLQVSVIGEIKTSADFYDYEDKYSAGTAETIIPADLSAAQISEIHDVVLQAASLLRTSGLARVDVFYEENGRGVLVNEVNTLPGFTPISMYPKMWEASGVLYADLIYELVELGVERHKQSQIFRNAVQSVPRGTP